MLLLPNSLSGLIHAEKLLHAGELESPAFFVEVFAGCAALSVAMVFKNVPTVKPWDTRHDPTLDVLSQGEILLQLIKCKRIKQAHFATPCRTNTWVREKQLRNRHFVRGLPCLSDGERALVSEANELVDWTLRACRALYLVKGWFSLENPEYSWLWWFQDILTLYRMPGVIATRFKMQWFGTSFVKPSIFLHNLPTFWQLGIPPERESRAVLSLLEKCQFEGRIVWKTALSQQYPPELAVKVAGYAQVLDTAHFGRLAKAARCLFD